MRRVPRKWAEWTVNLTKNCRRTMTSAVIYIGADVVTVACIVRGAHLPGPLYKTQEDTETKAKKRLGSRRYTPSLTQSLTLSHANKILHPLNSSAELTIILPAALFTRVKLAAPPELPPSDLAPTLGWAIQQQGFSPLQDWVWDAVSKVESSTGQSYWEACLLPASVADNYLQRLGIKQTRVGRLIPDDHTSPCKVDLPMGPWLNDVQAQLSLGYLQQRVGEITTNTGGTGNYSPPRTSSSSLPLNLACNLITQTNHRYYRGFLQCVFMTSAILMAVAVWWAQQTPPTSVTEQASDAERLVLTTPLQPFLQHIQLWQALYVLDGEGVSIQQLEYLRGRWLLQIETLNPNAATEWLLRLDQELNSLHGNLSPAIEPWRILTNASRSRLGSTIFDVEILQ